MVRKLNEPRRRILTFPAVHPSEATAPEALLSSLISLARSICSYKLKSLASNKRNGREAIRQIGVLLGFLEEIHGGQGVFSESVVLTFSELHVVFQKLLYLLEDCTLEGARLWMLMKSELVANCFRDLARSTSTALDVLPMGAIDVAIELKEHVELVKDQARRVRFDVESDDKEKIEDLKFILSRFESGICPEETQLRRVLDYLGIKMWSSCHKEVKFLDSEIEFQWLKKGKREMALLSSLMGFASYCRCVMFDAVDGESSRQTDGGCRSGVISYLNPDDFLCPISLELMADPVTTVTGHTFDRSSILKWFKAGHTTCPKTGEKLPSMELVPNLALQRLSQQFCSANGIRLVDSGSRKRDITRTVSAGSLAAEQAVKLLANFLSAKLAGGSGEEKNRAAREIRLLSKANIFNRSCLVEAGTIPHLLTLLRSPDSSTQENAIAALLNLSKHSRSKSLVVENKGLELVVHVLKNGAKIEARQHAAGTLFYLASIEDYRNLIGESTEAIPALVELIRNGPDRAKKNAMVAIFGLLMHHGNHLRILRAGAVPLLINLLNSNAEALLTDSLSILATLAEKPEGAAAILHVGALNSIIGILDSSSSRAGKDYCVALLVALCINVGDQVTANLVKSPSLMASLYSLLSEGTSRASKKASALIRILHEFCDKKSSGSVRQVLPQERSVHAW